MAASEILIGDVVVLLDPYTNKSVDTVLYSAISKHALIITDMRELTVSNTECNFVFFEPAVPCIVTSKLLEEAIRDFKIKPFLIYRNDQIEEMFRDLADCSRANYMNIDWNLVYCVLHKDSALLELYQNMDKVPLDFAHSIDGMPVEYHAEVNRMYTSYLGQSHELRKLLDRNRKLEEVVNNYRSISKKTAAVIAELRQLLDKAIDDNRSYCAMMAENYDSTFTGLYVDRPKVLYIKTISHLSGIDTLLMVIYATLIKQYRFSCKVVKIVDNTNATCMRYIPNVYFALNSTYNTQDILLNDFVMALGGSNVLMGSLMMNRSGLDFLIIHDQRGTLSKSLDDALIDLTLYEMSGDYAVLGEYTNVLTDFEKEDAFLWKFSDIAEYTGSNTSKLANHPTIAKILDLML